MFFWHPGFAWACNRVTYDKIGGLYQEGILGAGDNIMCQLLIQKGTKRIVNIRFSIANRFNFGA